MNISQTIPRFDFEILYRVAMKRIAYNMTSKQLSFLIGKPDDYVDRMEVYPTPFYTSEDIRCIATALADTETDTYYPAVDDGSTVEVQLDRKYQNGHCNYTCSITTEEGIQAPFFSLKDSTGAIEEDLDTATREYSLVQDALKLLLKVGYFYESRLAIEAYMAINFFLTIKLSPNTIKRVLEKFCTPEIGLLQMVEIENNRFAYQQP